MKKELKLRLNLHEDSVEPPIETETTEPEVEPSTEVVVKAEEIADDDKGFLAFMKKALGFNDQEPVETLVEKDTEPDDKSELALKYKNRYKEKYANQINETNAAKELAELKLSVATAKADGRAFDSKYLDFVCGEIQKSGKKPEEWLTEHPEYFEKQSASAPIVKTNMSVSSADQEYMNFLAKQRK